MLIKCLRINTYTSNILTQKDDTQRSPTKLIPKLFLFHCLLLHSLLPLELQRKRLQNSNTQQQGNQHISLTNHEITQLQLNPLIYPSPKEQNQKLRLQKQTYLASLTKFPSLKVARKQ